MRKPRAPAHKVVAPRGVPRVVQPQEVQVVRPEEPQEVRVRVRALRVPVRALRVPVLPEQLLLEESQERLLVLPQPSQGWAWLEP